MKNGYMFIIALLALTLAGCKSSCPSGSVTYLADASLFPAFNEENEAAFPLSPEQIELKGESVMVDRIISGPVCNDHWYGTVYVTCDIQVPAWEQDPFFWQDCDLDIDEGTVVYVQAHKDKSYDNGCSCHE
jgi:hypothetical protein